MQFRRNQSTSFKNQLEHCVKNTLCSEGDTGEDSGVPMDIRIQQNEYFLSSPNTLVILFAIRQLSKCLTLAANNFLNLPDCESNLCSANVTQSDRLVRNASHVADKRVAASWNSWKKAST